MAKLKKGKYKFLKVKKIKSDELFSLYKKILEPLVEKYHRHDGDPWLFYNTPIYLFAKEYVDDKKNFVKNLDRSFFVLCSMKRYNYYEEKYKKELAKRIMKIVDSIKKNGYAKGKYKHDLIGIIKREIKGYSLISGKHRAAACLALGMKIIKCNLYKKIK